MKNAEQVISDGKWIGTIWETEDCGWACEVNDSGNTWDFIDSREDAIELVLSEQK